MEHPLLPIYFNHSTAHQSLTRRALGIIIINIIYKSKKLLNIEAINDLVNTKFDIRLTRRDINETITWLKRDFVLERNGNFTLKQKTKEALDKEDSTQNKCLEDIVVHYFKETSTFNKEGGLKIVTKLLNDFLVSFFIEYSYDWLRDISSNRLNRKKIEENRVEIICQNIFDKNELVDSSDRQWIVQKFIIFLRDGREVDKKVIWEYAVARFSATLLKARNNIDQYSLDVFRNAKFILDTNMLMVLELEEYSNNSALGLIEDAMIALSIEPCYLYITKSEYDSAVSHQIEEIKTLLDRFHWDVITDTDCYFIRTALLRQCKEKADFSLFFEQILKVPELFYEKLSLRLLDDEQIEALTQEGIKDERLKNEINNIYRKKKRFQKDKRPNPLSHDAALIKVASYLRSTNSDDKIFILTRDSTLRQYCNENLIRDELSLAIGIDSLIQMLALERGGVSENNAKYIDLFSKIIAEDIRGVDFVFQKEDLLILEKNEREISHLTNDQVKGLSRKINRLRVDGCDDKDIELLIQKEFTYLEREKNNETINLESIIQEHQKENQTLKNDKSSLEEENYFYRMQIQYDSAKRRVSKSRVIFAFILIISISFFFFIPYSLWAACFEYPIVSSLVISLITNIILQPTIVLKKLQIFYTDQENHSKSEYFRLLPSCDKHQKT